MEFLKLVGIAADVVMLTSCLPINHAEVPKVTATPQPKHEPHNSVNYGKKDLPAQFKFQPNDNNYYSIAVACHETVDPNNDCENHTDKALGGVVVEFVYINGKNVVVVTGDDGTAQDIQLRSEVYDPLSPNSVVLPPENLYIEGENVKICVGKVLLNNNEIAQLVLLPYSAENCK